MARKKYGPTISRAGRYRVRMRVNTDPVLLAVADALIPVGQRILDIARPNVPDAPPYGEGLVEMGRVAAYAMGKRVDHDTEVKSPRGFKPNKKGVDVIVGYGGRVAHLIEGGTVNMPARPFLGPAGLAVSGEVQGIVRDNINLGDR